MGDTGQEQVQVGPPTNLGNAETCPDCGHDELLTFPLWNLTPDGLDELATIKRCAWCFCDQNPDKCAEDDDPPDWFQ